MPVLTEFPFGGGINEHISKRMLPDGVLEYCENFRPGLLGELVTRPGYTALSMDSLVAGTFTALDITSHGEQLVAVGRSFGSTGPRELFVYHGTSGTWAWRGQLQGAGQLAINPVSELQEIWHAPVGIRATQSDLAYANGHVCCAYYNSASDTASVHIFTTDGKTVLAETFTNLDSIRVSGAGNFLVVATLDNSLVLALRSFDVTSSEALSAPTTAATSVVVGGGQGAWDFSPLGGSTDSLLMYRVGSEVRWQRRSTALAQVGSTVVVATDATSQHFSIQGQTGETVNTMYRTAAGNYVLRSYTESTSVSLAGPTTIVVTNCNGQALLARRASTTIHIGIRGTGDIRGKVVYSTVLTSNHATITDAATLHELDVTGKAFAFDGNASGDYIGAPGLKYHAGDIGAFASGALMGIYPAPFVHGYSDYGVATPMTGPFPPHTAFLASTPGDGAGRFFWVTLRGEASTIGIDSVQGRPVVLSFKAGSSDRRQFAEFGGHLYQAGGVLGIFDGRENVESGFPTPEAEATPQTSGGAMDDGTFTAATLTTLPVTPPSLTIGGTAMLVSVDGGGFQEVRFDALDVDATTITAEFDALTGASAAVSGAASVITSGTTGAASSLLIGAASAGLLAVLGFFEGQEAVGESTPARYRYKFCHLWQDKLGYLHRSAPSPEILVTMAAGNNQVELTIQSAHTSRRNDSTGDSGSVLQTEIYRTKDNQATFFLVDTKDNIGTYAQALTYIDIAHDDDLDGRPILYTQAVTPEDNAPGLACRYVAAGNERLGVAGLVDPFAYAFSKVLGVEEPANFALPGRIAYRGRLHEPVTGIVWDADRWVLFSAKRPYQVIGDGPSATGQGDFQRARAIDDAPGGAIDWAGILRTPFGIMFQLALDKLYALRGASLNWVGERVQQTLAAFPVIKASVYIKKQQLAVFACQNTGGGNGVLLICDFSQEGQQWYVDAVGAVSALAEHQGRIAYVQAGTVFLQDLAPGTGAHVDCLARFGRFRFNTVLGYGALTGLGVIGQYQGGTFSLFLDISLNDGKTWELLATLAFPGTYSVGDTFNLLKAPPLQRTPGYRLRVRTGSGSASSAGIILNSLVTETEKAYSLARLGSGETQ